MPVLRVALAMLALAGATALTPAAAHADVVRPVEGTQDFTTTDALVDVVDGPADDHAATIDTRLYVPEGATAQTPQPAILMTHGFGLDKLATEVVASATFLARHGYVVLTYTSQGFGESTGCVTLQSRTYDVKDASQLITALLDPRPDVLHDDAGAVVGMVGGSYGGGIQLNLAESDARIHAISPARTWNSLQYSLDPNNRVAPGDPTGFSHQAAEQGVFKLAWTSLFFASGNSNPANGDGTCPQDKLASGDPLEVAGLPCLGFITDVCRTYAGLLATGDASAEDKALVADASGATQVDRLRVPTLLVQGQADTLFNLNDAVSTYTSLRSNGVPVKMIWNSGGHGGYDSLPGECDVYGRGTGGDDFRGLDDCYLSLRTLAFLDEALRGIPDPSPGLTYFQDWTDYDGAGANDEQYGDAPAFPAMPSTTFALSGSDALVPDVLPATAGSASFVNPPGGVPPAYSETSNFMGPAASPRVALPPTEQPGQFASFTSEPFAADLVSVGVPTARLQLSHTSPGDLVFFGKVFDVAPDGSAELIHRLVAPVRVPADAVDEPVDLNLLGFAHRFERGHAVRLTLAATDATAYNSRLPDTITVTTGAGSTFSLPGILTVLGPPTGPVERPPAAAPTPPAPASRALPATGAPPALPLAATALLAATWLALRPARRGPGATPSRT